MTQSADEKIREFRDTYAMLAKEMRKFIAGQDEIIEGVLTALFAGGHVLLEGVPGLGKTMLVKTLAAAVDLDFSRIQFTPDLMPADVVGTNIITEDENGRKVFQFRRGPVFANILLADEINRATPKTQSALLEAMQEQHVTVGGHAHALPRPFFVLATQNPLEMEGTYPLPEAQLDRFIFKLRVRYPDAEELHTILDRTTSGEAPKIDKVLSEPAVLLNLRDSIRMVPIARDVQDCAVRIVLATHPDNERATASVRKFVRYGASPRGAQAMTLAAKIYALLDGRFHVSESDIAKAAPDALRHRVILNFEGEAEGISSDEIIAEVMGANA